eukprot:11272366-Karenia_brevis.AAC.1
MDSLVTGKIDEKTPLEVLKDSDNYNRRLLAEARDVANDIADDDPNREYWIYRAKLDVLMNARFNHDVVKGYTWREAKTRKTARMRRCIKQA